MNYIDHTSYNNLIHNAVGKVSILRILQHRSRLEASRSRGYGPVQIHKYFVVHTRGIDMEWYRGSGRVRCYIGYPKAKDLVHPSHFIKVSCFVFFVWGMLRHSKFSLHHSYLKRDVFLPLSEPGMSLNCVGLFHLPGLASQQSPLQKDRDLK